MINVTHLGQKQLIGFSFCSFSSFLAGYLEMNITTEKEISQVLSKYTNGRGVLFTDEQI
jgi:hypothetical protein